MEDFKKICDDILYEKTWCVTTITDTIAELIEVNIKLVRYKDKLELEAINNKGCINNYLEMIESLEESIKIKKKLINAELFSLMLLTEKSSLLVTQKAFSSI